MPKKDVSESQNSIRVDETQSLYKKKCDGKSGVVTKLPPSNLPPLPPHRTALPKNVLTKTNKVFPEKKNTDRFFFRRLQLDKYPLCATVVETFEEKIQIAIKRVHTFI